MGTLQEIWSEVFAAHADERQGMIDPALQERIVARLRECFKATVKAPEAILLVVYTGGHSKFKSPGQESVGESALFIDADALLYCRSQAFVCNGWSLRIPYSAIQKQDLKITDEEILIPFFDEGKLEKSVFGIVTPARGREHFMKLLKEKIGL